MTVYDIVTDFGAVGDGVTDCSPAFVAAGNAMAADPGSDLVLPAGTFKFVSNASASGRTIQFWAKGVQGRILGAGIGVTILNLNGRAIGTGAIGVYHDGDHFGAIQSVSAGSLTAELVTLADYTIFPAGRWVMVCGLNQQDIYSDVPNTGYGYPPNFAFNEFIQIQSVDSVTGIITFETPLQQSYLSTWPHINDGNAFETTAAGEAGIHLLDAEWAADIEVHDLTITSTGNQLYAGCKSATFKNVDFPSSSSVIPSQNKTMIWDNVTTVVETEVDKLTENFSVLNSNVYRLTQQSATMRSFIIDNSNIGYTAELEATATTSIGNATVTIGGGVPSWVNAGLTMLYTSVLGQFSSTVTVASTTATTITFSANALKAVAIGDKFGFVRGGLNGAGLRATVTNSKLAMCQPGAFAYGVCPDPFTISNCEVWNWGYGGYQANAESIGTMANGIIELPNGTSTSNIVDNGSGKARYTVTTTAGLTAGKYIPSGSAYQELVATASTSAGSPTVTFGGGVPSWIVTGQILSYHTGSNKFSGGTTVLSKTATTITFSTNALNTVAIGNVFGFRASALTGDIFANPPGHQILSVVDGTTVDLDQSFPSGFVYAGGGNLNFGSAFGWARPDTYVYWCGTLSESGRFKVLDITQDAAKTYIQTNQSGGFPSLPKAATGLRVQTPGAQRVRASSLTGPAKNNIPLNDSKSYDKPLGSFGKFTFTGSDSALGQKAGTKMIGNLVSIVIDVTQAYTGSLFANLFVQLAQFPNLKFVIDGVSTDLGWGVNVKQVGRRVILPTDTVTNSTQLSGDSNLIVPAWTDHIWMINTPTASFQTSAGTSGTLRDISSEASNLWPIVEIEITTDQGFTFATSQSARVRLRLR